jgi:trimeric autotransporter adhesin
MNRLIHFEKPTPLFPVALALFNNTTGSNNTATGVQALNSNTTGNFNTANGNQALFSNTTGDAKTASGAGALFNNSHGSNNTADGNNALQSNTTGSSNIALGAGAGANLTTGDDNILIGNEGVAAEANTVRIGTQGTQTTTYIAGIAGTGVSGVPVNINAAGQLGIPPSAAPFKDQIRPMDHASEAILALKPVCFRYKKAVDPDGTPQFDLVAEEVER